ncbi:hypothetical protein D3C76_312110 [compost metagenome]
MAPRFHVVLSNTTHRLGAVNKLSQAFAHDAGQVQVLDGLGRQCILSGGGFLRDVQPPEKGQGRCTEHQDQQSQKAGGGKRTANHC